MANSELHVLFGGSDNGVDEDAEEGSTSFVHSRSHDSHSHDNDSVLSSEDMHSYDMDSLVQEHINCDAWSSMMVAMIFFKDKHSGRLKAFLPRMLYIASPVLIYTTNIILQLSVGWVFLDRFALPHAALYSLPDFDLQKATGQLHSATANSAPLFGIESYQMQDKAGALDILNKCKKEEAADIVWIYGILLFLWYAKALKEILSCSYLMHQIMSVQTRVSVNEEMIEKSCIQHLDASLKFWIVLLVPVPKLLIACILGWAGGLVLLVQNDVLHIVTKALVMQLIMTFDEVLTATLETQRQVLRLKSFKIQHQRFGNATWDSWLGSLVRYAFVLALTVMYSSLGCGGLNHFRLACAEQVQFE